MNRLLLFIKNPFAFSEKEKERIFELMEMYDCWIKHLAEQITKMRDNGEEIKKQPDLLKISNRYVFGKRCLAHHLSDLLGRRILADEISEGRITGKYILGETRRMISYYDVASNRVFMAKKKHFGIYVQYREHGNQKFNFFNNY